MSRQPLTEAGFWARMQQAPSGCWLWTGARDRDGYGNTTLAGKHLKAHRYAYFLTYGPIPDGMKVCHRCDNPSCCNPAHLFLGTDRDNWHDANSKGRRRFDTARGERSASAVLKEGQVRHIRSLYAAGGVTLKDLAFRFGVSVGAIEKVVNRRTWRHLQENEEGAVGS